MAPCRPPACESSAAGDPTSTKAAACQPRGARRWGLDGLLPLAWKPWSSRWQGLHAFNISRPIWRISLRPGCSGPAMHLSTAFSPTTSTPAARSSTPLHGGAAIQRFSLAFRAALRGPFTSTTRPRIHFDTIPAASSARGPVDLILGHRCPGHSWPGRPRPYVALEVCKGKLACLYRSCGRT